MPVVLALEVVVEVVEVVVRWRDTVALGYANLGEFSGTSYINNSPRLPSLLPRPRLQPRRYVQYSLYVYSSTVDAVALLLGTPLDAP
jgi:hypothetical protein